MHSFPRYFFSLQNLDYYHYSSSFSLFLVQLERGELEIKTMMNRMQLNDE